MNRVEHVLAIESDSLPANLLVYHYALINCLDLQELVELIQRTYNRKILAREGALRALHLHGPSRDAGEKMLDELVSSLGQTVSSGEYRDAIGAAYCINRLSGIVSREVIRDYVIAVARHRYAAVRRPSHGLAKMCWCEEVSKELLEAWREYADLSAWSSLVECDEGSTLAKYADELLYQEEDLDDQLKARLILKVANHREDILSKLRSVNHISYAYIVAKLGRRLEPEDAANLIEKSKNSEKFGLVLWSVGLAGGWDALLSIESELDDISKAVEQARLAEMGFPWTYDFGDDEEEEDPAGHRDT